jgi:hypothetical protein
MQISTAMLFPERGTAARAALLLGLFWCAHPGAAAASCAPGTLSWMVGEWHDASNPQGAQELWSLAPGAVLMGSAWSFPPAGTGGFAEIMTVRPQGDTLKMVLRHFDVGLSRAWEEREAPMEFLASQCTARVAVFEGSGARAGERLTYEATATGLDITGDFLHQGKPLQLKWHMTRRAD